LIFKFMKRIYSKLNRGLCLVSLGLLLLQGCNKNQESAPTPSTSNQVDALPAETATKWADMTLRIVRTSPGHTPVVSARVYGYMGLTMYETVVGGMPQNNSMAGQLNALRTLPKAAANTSYHWGEAMNAGQAFMLKNISANTSSANKLRIDSLETALRTGFKTAGATDEVLARSTKLGVDIATALFEWAKTDGGHEGYSRNFPTNFTMPVFPGAWTPTENGSRPMQPFWGNNRTMMAAVAGLPMPKPIAFSYEISSQYYAQYLEVYAKNRALTPEEKEIAVWWADDPGQTFTPPGHSYNITKIAVQKSKVGLGAAAEVFARIGIGLNDAFIMCWKCKYTFSNQRPYSYVRQVIDPNWIPFWPAPPFPGFTSGHATQSSTSAEILTQFFGNNFSFTDDSHVGRAAHQGTVLYKARTFNNFYEFADESAKSRFYGGIHTRQDNEVGLQEGRKLGRMVNALKFKKDSQ
jgi:PAP2 superfamily